MKQFSSVRKDSEFRMIYGNGISYANELLMIYVVKTGGDESHINISVSKKVGSSVVRHHITGPLRETFHLNNNRIKTGSNIILVARGATGQSDYKYLEGVYLYLCGLHHILKESK